MFFRILIALALTAVLAFGLEYGLDRRLPGWAVVGVYLALYFLIEWVGNRRAAGQGEDEEPDPDYSWLPTSGPIGRFGQWALIASFFSSQLLVLLNPFQLVQLLRQLVGNTALQARERASGDDGRSYQSKVRYRLPFDGEWLSYNGGMTPKTSHSWDVLG